MTFTFGLPKNSTIGIGPNEGKIKLYFKSQVNVRRSNLSYEFLTFVADIGGYLGLLLGFSVLDVTNILKQICVYYWRIFQDKVTKEQILQKSLNIEKKKSAVDELAKSTMRINKRTYSVYTIHN